MILKILPHLKIANISTFKTTYEKYRLNFNARIVRIKMLFICRVLYYTLVLN